MSYIGTIKFYRNVNGKAIGFKLTGQSNRKIRFEKVKGSLLSNVQNIDATVI